MSIDDQLRSGFETAFIDSAYNSNLAYRPEYIPEFVSNDYTKGKKVISIIENELCQCDKFYISVTFITRGGIIPLLETLEELEKRNIPGKILTTDYLNFSEPYALEKLNSLSNIELKMYRTNGETEGFHTKGYIFDTKGIYRIIIGSSNLTQRALTLNKEWNSKIISKSDGEFAENLMKEFKTLWFSKRSVSYDEVSYEYEALYKAGRLQKNTISTNEIVSLQDYKLTPNKMQLSFINSLSYLRKNGKDKALLISATGTGKTFASAFAMRDESQKRVLFLAHREQLTEQALKTYKRVFGKTKTFGLISGNHKDYAADYIFATMQTMSKPEIMEKFPKNYFDTIIIDEAHRTGARSYLSIWNYFTPSFWLGMTASPERTDDFDVFKQFDHNIAYEIRLKQAMEENLLCPFHYFGIKDIDGIEDIAKNNNKNKLKYFNLLTSDERVKNVIEKAKYYGYSGDRVKGLIFVSHTEEAKELSRKFNERGLRTLALSGSNSEEERETAIERLESDDSENALDYILTVDIFNEGVDIPKVNQIILLRPTQSPIVFVQQIGRGLRKADNKEYVVILDFIGNYQNNFMIPIALSGDRTYNKDTIRKYVASGNDIIPGASTIHFDEITKEKIYESIDRFSSKKKTIENIIENSYKNLKFRLGRVPKLIDFYREGEVDPIIILDNYKTYHEFMNKVDKDNYSGIINDKELTALQYLSKAVASGKRPSELVILKELLSNEIVSETDIIKEISTKFNFDVDDEHLDNAISVLNGNFVGKDEERIKLDFLGIAEISSGRNIIKRANFLKNSFSHKDFISQVEDITDYGLNAYKDRYKKGENNITDDTDFILYKKYSRRDVCWLLDWGKDYSATMFGMMSKNDCACIFVTYHKVIPEDGKVYVEGKPDYADEFINNEIFAWDSQIGRGPESKYMEQVLSAKRRLLFLKKSEDDRQFYYMGEMDIIDVKADTKLDNNKKPQVISKVKCKMKHPVKDDMLNYLKSYIQIK